jgi:hypothetical protein
MVPTNGLDNPLPVLPLEYAKPTTLPQRRRWVVWARVLLVLAAADLVVGWLLIPIVHAETVIVTAPILFVLGLGLIVTSWRVKLLIGAILGLAHCSLCLLFTMLVNARDWSPSDATLPFTIMGGVYTLAIALPLAAVTFLRVGRMAENMTASS